MVARWKNVRSVYLEIGLGEGPAPLSAVSADADCAPVLKPVLMRGKM